MVRPPATSHKTEDQFITQVEHSSEEEVVREKDLQLGILKQFTFSSELQVSVITPGVEGLKANSSLFVLLNKALFSSYGEICTP